MTKLSLTSDEAKRYVELIGPKLKTSKTFNPIFPLGLNKTIALVQHRVLDGDKYFDVIYILTKTEAGINCRKIIDTNDFIFIPAREKDIKIEYEYINEQPGSRADTLEIGFSIFTEKKIGLSAECAYFIPLTILFTV